MKTESGERCKVAIRTNNADLDNRSPVCIVDRADAGMHILARNGEARSIAEGR